MYGPKQRKISWCICKKKRTFTEGSALLYHYYPSRASYTWWSVHCTHSRCLTACFIETLPVFCGESRPQMRYKFAAWTQPHLPVWGLNKRFRVTGNSSESEIAIPGRLPLCGKLVFHQFGNCRLSLFVYSEAECMNCLIQVLCNFSGFNCRPFYHSLEVIRKLEEFICLLISGTLRVSGNYSR